MERKRDLARMFGDAADLPDEALPGLPLVEIAGNRRVLIENHLGVIGYGSQRICIKVKKGTVTVCGCHLELQRMTRSQIIITGRIDDVCLTGGNG